jgi:hypothetical protein
MATARKLIKKAMQKCGILTKNSEPEADELNDGLDALNAMLSSWANDSLLVYTRVREDFTLSGVEAYTIGTGGTFNTVRPVAILQAYTSLGGVKYNDLNIISDVTYQRAKLEIGLNGSPLWLNYDNNYPLGTIRVYPIPNVGYTLTLLSEKPLTTLTLDTDISYPPGWERAIIYNLAMEIIGEYGQQLDAVTMKIATDSLNSIKMNVAKNTSMDSKPTHGEFNIYRGW